MNNAILQRLNTDHKHLSKVLYCLSAQIRGYDDPDIQPSIPDIMNILDYVSTMPERWHHPVEDVVFKRLLEKSPPHPEQIKAVLQEHEDLERLTLELKTAFNSVALDTAVPIERLYRATTVYLSRQLLHLDAEESVLFPLAEEFLEEEDWQYIEEQVDIVMADFNDLIKAEYDAMYEGIVNFDASP